MKKNEKCCVLACQRRVAVYKHQLCSGHYQQFLRYGVPGNKLVRKLMRRDPYTKPV